MARFDLRSVLLLSTLLLSVLCHDDSEGFTCVHSLAPEERKGLRIPEPRTKAQKYYIPDEKRGERQAGRQNIRIHVDTRFLDIPANPADQPDPDYTCYAVGQQITDQSGATFTCTANETLSSTKMNFLKNFLLVDAVSTLQNALLVDSVQGNLMLTNEDCSGSSYTPTYIPQEYINPGRPNTDVVLIATARRIIGDRVLAFAGPCLEDTRGRPTAGFINFNPVKLTTIRDSGYEASLATAIHEMTHALGFLESKFSQFRYGGIENNTKIPVSDVVISQSVDNGQRTITKIKTPTVLEKVRKHFGCSTIDGAEIENGGGPGTAGSHWEKRIFNYEYMVGSITKRPVISEITLALLQDSGWYTANFSAADSFKWGWNEGCDFLEKKCNTWTGEGYFCSASSQTGCNFDRSGFSYCSLGNEPNLPDYYTYLGQANYAGTDTLADYCPYLVPYSNSWCFDTANQQPFTVNQGQMRGENSRCFDTTLSDSLSAAQKASTCYVTYCPNNSTLAIKLDKYWYNCPIGGSIKDPGIFVGELTCPKTQIICKDAKEDTTWPTFTSIEPNTGEPEEEVTIKGTNFVPDMTIVINEPATNCEFVDTQTYKCNVASQNVFTNPKHLVGTDEDVVLVHPSGDKSCVGLKAFHLEMNYAKGLAKQIGNWIKKNPAYAGIIIGALVLAIIGCCVFCWWEGRKARRGKRRDRD